MLLTWCNASLATPGQGRWCTHLASLNLLAVTIRRRASSNKTGYGQLCKPSLKRMKDGTSEE